MAFPDSVEPGLGGETSSAAVISTLMGWLGAAISIAMVAGLVWWAYDLVTRDSRAVPVVRAMEGPARVAPDDPGGFKADHKGYAVNRIASDESGATLADRIVLAPEAEGMEEGDLPVADLRPERRDAVIRSSVATALEQAIPADVFEGGDAASGDGADGGRVALPRPVPRPDIGVASRAAASPTITPVALAAGPSAVDPTEIPAGTRLVQLGAYDSEQVALSEWDRLRAKFADYMGDKSRVIEPAQIGDQTFYRLRAHGFAGLSDARYFCSALIAEQADCIPVLTR